MFYYLRYSDLPILPDDNSNIFAAFHLISYCSCSSLILSSVVMISFYIIFKKLFSKRKGLLDARVRVVSITKKNMVLLHIFYKDS